MDGRELDNSPVGKDLIEAEDTGALPEEQVTSMEGAAAEKVVESGEQGFVAELREEMCQPRQRVARIEARSPQGTLGQWGLIPTLLGLVLVTAVGGILWSHQARRRLTFTAGRRPIPILCSLASANSTVMVHFRLAANPPPTA